MIKILNLYLVILLEYQNIKTFLQKAMLQTLRHGRMLLVILNMKKVLEGFMKKNCKKQIKNIFSS